MKPDTSQGPTTTSPFSDVSRLRTPGAGWCLYGRAEHEDLDSSHLFSARACGGSQRRECNARAFGLALPAEIVDITVYDSETQAIPVHGELLKKRLNIVCYTLLAIVDGRSNRAALYRPLTT